MSELDDFLADVLPRQVAAETAMHEGDPEPRLAMWSERDPVTLLGAEVPSRSGREEMDRAFRWVASRFTACKDYRFELVAAGASGDLGYTVGFERSEVSIRGGPFVPNVLRVTHVYRREDGEWTIVHRHGDPQPADRSPAAG